MIEFLLPSVLPPLFLFAGVWYAAARPRSSHLVGWGLGLAFLIGCVAGMKVFVLQVAVMAFLWVLCNIAAGGVSVRRSAAVGALLVSLGLSYKESVIETEHLASLRDQYPLQSMSPRLAYETKPSTAQTESSAGPIALATDVEKQLQQAEYLAQSTNFRGDALAKLHRDDSDRRIALASFVPQYYSGSFVNRVIALPSPREIPLTEPPPHRGCAPAPEPEYVPEPGPNDSTAPLYAFREFHDDGARNFLNPDRFGHVRDREHVAGFASHAFESMPALRTPKTSGPWKLEHLDLVSVQKPSGPHVYVTAYLPKCDDLKSADTRLLDDFETRALSRLRTDEDVVIEDSDGVVRMMGALRAGSHCIQCHSVQRGELIGAFSYELIRQTPGKKTEHVADADGPPET